MIEGINLSPWYGSNYVLNHETLLRLTYPESFETTRLWRSSARYHSDGTGSSHGCCSDLDVVATMLARGEMVCHLKNEVGKLKVCEQRV